MLDCYQWGRIERISPEAPAPVLHVQKEERRLGGAANVAHNLLSLGAKVKLVGITGDDGASKTIIQCLLEMGLDGEGIVQDATRETTVKLRMMARQQQLLRCDWESTHPTNQETQRHLLTKLAAVLHWADGVIVSDYAKGVVTRELMQALVQHCQAHQKHLIVDPKVEDYKMYSGCSCLTPNDKEAYRATHLAGQNLESVAVAAKHILRTTKAEATCITLGSNGVMAVLANGESRHFPAHAYEVFDVTGAGDTFIAMLASWWCGSGNFFDAVNMANIAAGIAVTKLGVASVNMGEVQAALHLAPQGYLECAQAKEWVKSQQGQGKQVVFTNGCFDLLHLGHVQYLQRSRAMGHALVVGLNSDASVRRLKGPARPLQGDTERATILAALACVDVVVIFEEDTPRNLINALQPNILTKGADYAMDEIVGAKEVQSWGGKVERIALLPNRSTSHLIERMRLLPKQ